HALVGGKYVAMQVAQALTLRVANKMAHQRPPDTAALEIAAHDHGIFGARVVRVRSEPRHTEQLPLLLSQRHESYGPGIVDLCEAGDDRVGEFLPRTEKAEADVLDEKLLEEGAIKRLVGRQDRSNHDAHSALGFDSSFPAVGIRPNGKTRI